MYMKDMMGNSMSDDAEFDDLDEFDYVDQFISKDDDGDMSAGADDELDDLDDLYVEDEGELDEMDEFEEMEGEEDEEFAEEEDEELLEDDMGDMDDDLEAKFICDECGHKWVDFVSETDDENDLFEMNCPMCGSSNVTTDR